MGDVRDAITAELDKLRVADDAPGLSELAVSLAQSVDDSDAPTAKAVAARELRAVMIELRRLAPVGEEGDALDDLTRRREARRARGA
ncbi:hypothetical protein [Streptomyces sp. RTd22]|uniref:hypothetical protein n=1 Tax=Streptomyces sp. RTd22 TaxID=1841249 RepID=UPI001F405C62|nr:hypothetical protein [Streptomyces sp. RTd22]